VKYKCNRKVDLILTRTISLKYMRPCMGNLADFWWSKIQWKLLVVITLGHRETNRMITLSQLSFLMSKVIFRKQHLFKLNKIDYFIWMITLSSTFCIILFWINFSNSRLSLRKFVDPKQNIPNEFFKFFRRKLWRTLVLKIQVNK
jgi:hypothetical protein